MSFPLFNQLKQTVNVALASVGAVKGSGSDWSAEQAKRALPNYLTPAEYQRAVEEINKFVGVY